MKLKRFYCGSSVAIIPKNKYFTSFQGEMLAERLEMERIISNPKFDGQAAWDFQQLGGKLSDLEDCLNLPIIGYLKIGERI